MSKAKTATRRAPPEPGVPLQEKFFALVAGLWLGLTLLKFGNPIIFDNMIVRPGNLAEFIFTPWPLAWGYLLLVVVAISAVRFARPQFSFREHWPIAALGIWFFWQFLSHARTVSPRLSTPTLIHFGGCIVAFLMGWWALGRVRDLRWFWAPVILGYFYVLLSGFDQHYGGLEATRKAFYEQPNWQLYPKEYLLKIQTNRIFGTLVYPNALAGVILLLTPIAVWKTWEIGARWPRLARGVVFGILCYMSAACLFWTGSKGGWLVALLVALVGILHLSLPKKLKLTVMGVSLALGLVFFFVRFSGYFERGATSVSARFTYWQAAFQTARENPILGTGPGTFQVPYGRIKPPEAEMARLTHNDYLEQASDSGWPGAVAFAVFVFGSLWKLYRERPTGDWSFFLVWLALLGWAAQAFIEFGLYIPAIAWTAFAFLGILWSRRRNVSGVSVNANQ